MEHIKTQSTGHRTLDPHHGHEVTDINIKGVLVFGLVLFISAVVIHVALWGFYVGLDRYGEKFAPAVAATGERAFEKEDPLLAQNKRQETAAKTAETQQQLMNRLVSTFPAPRLQDDNVRDMAELRVSEDQVLKSYTYLDQRNGRVTIPIDRAMELLLERGIPTRAQAPAAGQQQSGRQARPQPQNQQQRPTIPAPQQ